LDKKVLKKTTKLWAKAVEEELLDDIEADVAIGAHYAKLALDGTVELTESGVEKVEAAFEALSELIEEDE
jgi:preprotein translocase subunit SecA